MNDRPQNVLGNVVRKLCLLLVTASLSGCSGDPAWLNQELGKLRSDQLSYIEFIGQKSQEVSRADRERLAQTLIEGEAMLVREGKIRRGMTTRQVLLAWGKPWTAYQPSFIGHGMSETWVYWIDDDGRGPYRKELHIDFRRSVGDDSLRTIDGEDPNMEGPGFVKAGCRRDSTP